MRLLTSSGNVLLCRFGNDTKYVRLIRSHTPMKEYINNSIDLFFDLNIDCRSIAKYRDKAHSDLLERNNYTKMKRIEQSVQLNVKRLASREFVDTSVFGFPSLYDEEFYPFASAFILFLRGEMTAYRDNSKLINKKNDLQTFSCNLQCATKSLSVLLGLGELIPNIEMRTMDINGKQYIVSVMDPSPGIEANKLDMDSRHIFNSDFVKSISNLDYFDSICYQTDHKLRNYNIKNDDNGTLVGVSAFDNDAPFTFLPIFAFPTKVSLIDRYTPVYKKGKINREFIDCSLADALCSISKTQLFGTLVNYLTYIQIYAVWFRIKKLKKCIVRYKIDNPYFFVDFSETLDVSCYKVDVKGEFTIMDYLTNFQINNERERYKHIKM